MGYRSDVTLVMKQVDYEKMCEDLASNSIAMNYIDCIDNTLILNNREGTSYVCLDWYSIKWYDDDITDYLNSTPDEVYYEFIRIGEDWDDAQYEFNVPDGEMYRLRIRRETEFYDDDLVCLD